MGHDQNKSEPIVVRLETQPEFWDRMKALHKANREAKKDARRQQKKPGSALKTLLLLAIAFVVVAYLIGSNK